jgi:hypothetical protein
MRNYFIDLNRRFVTIPRDYSFNEEDFDLPMTFGLLETKGWNDLLQLPRVIILAKAGAGKTEEIQAITKRLRDDGKKAFFFRLEHVNSNFEASFEIGTISEFEEWITSGELGWFFLDSVDEARLHSPYQFEAAIRKFGAKMSDHKHRAHVFITSRISEWRAQSDLELIKTNVPLINPLQISKEEDKSQTHLLEGSSDGMMMNTKGKPRLNDPAVFALCPLDQDQRRTFSQAFGVQDVAAFLSAIEKTEAEIFASWPQDLIELIDFWKQHGKIANRAELIKNSITTKLNERDPERASELPLNFEEAMYGAEMLAAAVTFLQKNRILIPEQTRGPQIKIDAIDVQCVLKNWNQKQIRALLQRPIFDRAIYGCVRFHHRNIREYLTAQWLHRLLQNGKSRRTIESLFFKERHGRLVLVPSMRPVLSWLVLFDDRIREKVAKVAPEIFVEGGDPSALSIETRKRFLEKLCSHYANQKRWDFSFDISEVRRFAHPDLGLTVNELLKAYRNHEEIRELLLRMIWQGEIQVCAEMALEFALDDAVDTHSRACAVRAVGAAGSNDLKKKLVEAIITDSMLKKGDLIGEFITAFAPDLLRTQDVLKLIERVEKSKEYSYTRMEADLKEYCLERCPEEEILKWCQGLLPLLKQPPVIERQYFEVSRKYRWILPYAILAVERLVRLKCPNVFDAAVLEIISLAQKAERYHDYYMKDHTLAELIPKWPELNHALFWFNVNAVRRHLDQENHGRLTDYGQAFVHNHYWRFTEKDFGKLLEDITIKPDLDDRLVALSLAFQLYREMGRGRVRRQALKKAVKGAPMLEERLNIFLKPSPMSEEVKRIRRSITDSKKRQKQREKKEANNREKWREQLQMNKSILRDTSIASSGGIWNSTLYLLHELQEKQGSSDDNMQNWEGLIPEFGQDVAEAFRDGCINYWKEYCPKLRSEGIENPNSIPYAVIIGSIGLKMEARHIPDWPNNLSKNKAKLACHYAMLDINNFPNWLQRLHAVFPDIVEAMFLEEIAWEFSQYDRDDYCHYVLSKITYGSSWLIPKIGNRILTYLQDYEPRHDDTLNKAIGIVLSNSGLDQAAFVRIAKSKIEMSLSPSRKALWLAGWMCVDANGALETLRSVLANLISFEDATKFSTLFVISLLGDGRVDVQREYQDFIRPEILFSLIKLMHTYIHISDDIHRVGIGIYRPELRDNAQRARDRLFELLRDIPGKETYLAMMNLSIDTADEPMREWYAVSARRRAAADAEAGPWISEDIAHFTEEAERAPQNHRELFDLSVSRLLDLKAELEEGDTSLAIILQPIQDETKHRLAVAGWLRDRSRGRYSVPQEEELADGTKPDIRIHGCGFDGPVPIELKIVDNSWSAVDLVERLRNQLCDQYLLDIRSNCGIFLLVFLGKKKFWKHPNSGNNLDFSELVQFLKEEAKEAAVNKDKIESIEVIGIDLTRRNPRRGSTVYG